MLRCSSVGRLVDYLPSIHKALGSSPALHKLDIVVCLYSNTYNVEAGGSETQCHPQLHSEANLGYVRSCDKTNKQERKCVARESFLLRGNTQFGSFGVLHSNKWYRDGGKHSSTLGGTDMDP